MYIYMTATESLHWAYTPSGSEPIGNLSSSQADGPGVEKPSTPVRFASASWGAVLGRSEATRIGNGDVYDDVPCDCDVLPLGHVNAWV